MDLSFFKIPLVIFELNPAKNKPININITDVKLKTVTIRSLKNVVKQYKKRGDVPKENGGQTQQITGNKTVQKL